MTNNFKISTWLFRSMLMMILCLMACQDDEDTLNPGIQEKAGHIPGFGEAPGEPTGEKLVLPKNITITSIVGDETGIGRDECVVDGAGPFVMVSVIIENDSVGPGPTTVTFPPGLVIVTALEGFQNGLLIERVLVTVPPKVEGGGGDSGKCNVKLMLYCLNSARKHSDSTAKYKIGPVTDSPLIKDFLQRLSGKKLLYSEYAGNDDFWINSENIQTALWSLTDDDGLKKRDLEYIRTLPDK
jgi:hypothetical protein